MDNGELNLAWARALLGELAASGARHVCVSPGARSAPLALAADERGDLATTVHVDERSAAFFALGAAKATGTPCVLVCTSGTAAANFLPAIVEAYYDGVPLVVLTADRPSELRDTGAWQAIDQVGLYGGYVRWSAEVAVPGTMPGVEGLRYVRSLGSRAIAESTIRPSGPVHLNLPFREPLVPAELSAHQSAGKPATAVEPHSTVIGGSPVMTADELDRLADEIAAEPHGLILAGRLRPRPAGDGAAARHAAAVAQLADATGYPVLAEPSGGLRFGAHEKSHVIAGYDALIRAEGWAGAHRPRVAIRIGASFAWRQVAEFIDRAPDLRQITLDPQRAWDDPLRTGGIRLHVEPVPFCCSLAARLDGRAGPDGAWLAEWRGAADTATRLQATAVSRAGDATVGWVYETLPALLADGTLVHAANSMAVRDLDTFTSPSATRLQVLTNRGAAGIDGTLSSGLGAAYATGRPAVVLTGDLAFAHDLGGLAAARLPGLDVTIVVLNDGGGGIFEHTPMAGLPAQDFERLFLVPSGVDIAPACAAFGVPHTVVSDRAGLAAVLSAGLGGSGVRVAEVVIDRAASTALHRDYWAGVAGALGG